STAVTAKYPLSLHDALPIYRGKICSVRWATRWVTGYVSGRERPWKWWSVGWSRASDRRAHAAAGGEIPRPRCVWGGLFLGEEKGHFTPSVHITQTSRGHSSQRASFLNRSRSWITKCPW